MNTTRMSHIIADPTALATLQKCVSVNELVACLNWAGAECTREEGLRFLRTWEQLATEYEPLDEDEMDMVAGGVGPIDPVKPMLERDTVPNRKLVPDIEPNPLTIETILSRMNK